MVIINNLKFNTNPKNLIINDKDNDLPFQNGSKYLEKKNSSLWNLLAASGWCEFYVRFTLPTTLWLFGYEAILLLFRVFSRYFRFRCMLVLVVRCVRIPQLLYNWMKSIIQSEAFVHLLFFHSGPKQQHNVDYNFFFSSSALFHTVDVCFICTHSYGTKETHIMNIRHIRDGFCLCAGFFVLFF